MHCACYMTLLLEQDWRKSAVDLTEKAEIRHNSWQLVKHPRLYSVTPGTGFNIKKRKFVDSSRFPAEGTWIPVCGTSLQGEKKCGCDTKKPTFFVQLWPSLSADIPSPSSCLPSDAGNWNIKSNYFSESHIAHSSVTATHLHPIILLQLDKSRLLLYLVFHLTPVTEISSQTISVIITQSLLWLICIQSEHQVKWFWSHISVNPSTPLHPIILLQLDKSRLLYLSQSFDSSASILLQSDKARLLLILSSLWHL